MDLAITPFAARMLIWLIPEFNEQFLSSTNDITWLQDYDLLEHFSEKWIKIYEQEHEQVEKKAGEEKIAQP